MKKINWWTLIILTGTLAACLEPEINTLPFFTASTFTINTADIREVGQVVLKGQVSDLDDHVLDDYGFIFTTDPANTYSDNLIDAFSQGASFGDEDLLEIIDTLDFEEGVEYYYQAYARKGERITYGDTLRFSLKLDLSVLGFNRVNDTLFYKFRLAGLGLNEVKAMGVFIDEESSSTPLTLFASTEYSERSTDTMFIDTLLSVNFNHSYRFRPYAVGVIDTIWGEPFTFEVTDGWYRNNDLPQPIDNTAVAIIDGNIARLIGGCNQAVGSDRCPQMDVNTDLIDFEITAIDGSGEWQTTPMENCDIIGSEGVLYQEGGNIYWGFSRYDYNGMPNHQNYFTIPPDCLTPFYLFMDIEKIANMVAFQIGDKLYIGTGALAGGDTTNEFWEVSINDGTWQAEPMPLLPVRINGEDVTENVGREGANVLEVGDRYFVGFGNDGIFQYQDVYEFIPPSDSEAASWKFIGLATESGPREEAISFQVNGRAYLGFGYNQQKGYLNDFWEFVPDENPQWIEREPLPGLGRRSGFGFSLQNFGYIGGGKTLEFGPVSTLELLRDSWIYYPAE